LQVFTGTLSASGSLGNADVRDQVIGCMCLLIMALLTASDNDMMKGRREACRTKGASRFLRLFAVARTRSSIQAAENQSLSAGGSSPLANVSGALPVWRWGDLSDKKIISICCKSTTFCVASNVRGFSGMVV